MDSTTNAFAFNPRPPWRKVLWARQPYPANYIDKHRFLDGLQINGQDPLTISDKIRSQSFNTWLHLSLNYFLDCQSVVQHFLSVCLHALLFQALYLGKLSGKGLLWLSHLSIFVAYICWIQVGIRPFHTGTPTRSMAKQVAKSGLILMIFLVFMSPVLWTLTQAIATDTVFTMTTYLYITCLCSFDYSHGKKNEKGTGGQQSGHKESLPASMKALSLNAAVLASVVLASRLSSPGHVFTFLSVSLVWFALFPAMRRYLLVHYAQNLNLGLTGVLLGACFFLARSKCQQVAITSVACLIGVICPAYYAHMQRCKFVITGPWDEVKLTKEDLKVTIDVNQVYQDLLTGKRKLLK